MRPLGSVLRLARERRVVVLLPRRQLQDRLRREPPLVGQLVHDVLDTIGQHVPQAVDPGDLGCRLSTVADALQLDLPVLGGDEVVTLDYLGGIGGHQDGQGGEAAPDGRLVSGTRGDLTLVFGVVVQHHRVDFEGVVTWKEKLWWRER